VIFSSSCSTRSGPLLYQPRLRAIATSNQVSCSCSPTMDELEHVEAYAWKAWRPALVVPVPQNLKTVTSQSGVWVLFQGGLRLAASQVYCSPGQCCCTAGTHQFAESSSMSSHIMAFHSSMLTGSCSCTVGAMLMAGTGFLRVGSRPACMPVTILCTPSP